MARIRTSDARVLCLRFCCKQYTYRHSTYRAAQHDHANTRGSSRLHATSTTTLSSSSPFFSPTSQTLTILLEHNEHLGPDEPPHCDDLRQSGSFTQTVTHTSPEGDLCKFVWTDLWALPCQRNGVRRKRWTEERRSVATSRPARIPLCVSSKFVFKLQCELLVDSGQKKSCASYERTRLVRDSIAKFDSERRNHES